MGIEHLVDITETTGAYRNAVFRNQKCTAGSGAGENRGANRIQAFLAIIAVAAVTRQAIQCLLVVSKADQIQLRLP